MLILEIGILSLDLLPTSNASIGFGAVNAMKKSKSTLDATETNNFRKNEKAMITNLVQKLLEPSLTYLLTSFA